jgi:N-acetylglucosaminyldiphosphoundecaprenol N-acetyl-beta-D-mannosaminyltransferase
MESTAGLTPHSRAAARLPGRRGRSKEFPLPTGHAAGTEGIYLEGDCLMSPDAGTESSLSETLAASFPGPKRAPRLTFLGVPLDPLSMRETLDLADYAMANRVRMQHVAVNVAKIITIRANPDLRRDVLESDIISVDGMGVIWGARLAGHRLPERVAGIDLMEHLLKLCADRGYRPFILGARQEVLDLALARIRERHPRLRIAGSRNGYFSRDDEPQIVDEIRQSKPDCLFVAISSPIKERFTRQYRDLLGVPFLMGVGGSIDVMAGLTSRAPLWVQRIGCEWLYRLGQEPTRLWHRYLMTNSAFAVLLAAELARTHFGRSRLATGRGFPDHHAD